MDRAQIRESYWNYTINIQTQRKNIGFDWRKKLFSKTLSTYLLSDPKRNDILLQIQKLLVILINKIGQIGLFFNYAEKNNIEKTK